MQAFYFSNSQDFNSAEEIIKKLDADYQKDETKSLIFINGDLYIDMVSMNLDNSQIQYEMTNQKLTVYNIPSKSKTSKSFVIYND